MKLLKIILLLGALFCMSFSFAQRKNAVIVDTKAPPQESVQVNLNLATLPELLTVPGINPARAKSILAYRKKQGVFQTVDELGKIAGFKRLKAPELESLKKHFMLATEIKK